MAHNPLLGSSISLISKKNIRYEGTLYSINEKEATVALQNVRTFGTEGREKIDDNVSNTFVPRQDGVHPYLLFRGCDIKDLHVHESAASNEPSMDPAIVSTIALPNAIARSDPSNSEERKQGEETKKAKLGAKQKVSTQNNVANSQKYEVKPCDTICETAPLSSPKKIPKGKQFGARRPKRNMPKQMVGSGECLLNRKARGVVDGASGLNEEITGDFDFETNLAEFDKVNTTDNDTTIVKKQADDDRLVEDNSSGVTSVYHKDDFFDSISCDVLDKQNGIDNRLRGSDERNLNTETFGAVSLGNRRRGGRRNRHLYVGGGRGRGGRYVISGDGRYNDGARPRENNRWVRESVELLGSSNASRRTFGNGRIPTVQNG